MYINSSDEGNIPWVLAKLHWVLTKLQRQT